MSVVEPVTVPEVAEIVVVPIVNADASPPFGPAVMVAEAGVLEAQVAEALRFCVLPSE